MRDLLQYGTMEREPHGRNLRKGRYSGPGRVYLVTCVAHQRAGLFSSLYCGRIVVRQLMRAESANWTTTLAYVVMPDHLHWLFVLTGNVSLADIVGNVKRHSSREIRNNRCDAGLRVWQRGFHDHGLRNEESLVAVSRYVITNPLRAGLAKRVGDYPLWDAVYL
jgi:REP element-mobilizing transposase RayT